MAQFAWNAHWAEPSPPLFGHRARPTPLKCKNEYLVLFCPQHSFFLYSSWHPNIGSLLIADVYLGSGVTNGAKCFYQGTCPRRVVLVRLVFPFTSPQQWPKITSIPLVDPALIIIAPSLSCRKILEGLGVYIPANELALARPIRVVLAGEL